MGRWPTVPELAEACGLTEDDVYAAMELAYKGVPRSLDERMGGEDGDGGVSLSEMVGDDDAEFAISLDRLTLAAALGTLPAREKKILLLRYFQGMSQSQTARRVSLSQMHVSRLERAALLKLRLLIQSRREPEPTTDRGAPPASSRIATEP